jgi:hypothetical protein
MPQADAAVVRIFYRHVNQAERWESTPMESRDGRYRATVPADYIKSPFPLQYYFEVQRAGQPPGIHPGFAPELNNQPYYLVRQSRPRRVTTVSAGSKLSASYHGRQSLHELQSQPG